MVVISWTHNCFKLQLFTWHHDTLPVLLENHNEKSIDMLRRQDYTMHMFNGSEIYKMLKWIGTIAGIIGSLLVAMNNGLQFIGYICFLIGAVSWLIASIKTNDKAGIIQWLFFTGVNIMGILNYA